MFRAHQRMLAITRERKKRNQNKEWRTNRTHGGTGLRLRAGDTPDRECVGWSEMHPEHIANNNRGHDPHERVLHDRSRWALRKAADTSRRMLRDAKLSMQRDWSWPAHVPPLTHAHVP